MTESVIDFPKDTLCEDIWQKTLDQNGEQEIWVLREDVRSLLIELCAQLMAAIKINNYYVHITGSITSNSYTSNADVDVHFLSKAIKIKDIDALNKLLRTKFKQLSTTNPSYASIGEHPIEVYFQENEYQDFMSVGCFNLLENTWEVGPELKPTDFNPYNEYYDKVKARVSIYIDRIRTTIFSAYEAAIVCQKSRYIKGYDDVIQALKEAKIVYEQLRQSRKVYSSPVSKEQALEFRNSLKWHIADATFKLLDKYGYLQILKKFTEYLNLVDNSHEVSVEVISGIIQIIKTSIGDEKKLAEIESLDEGAKEVFSLLTLAGMLAIPGIMTPKALAAELKTLPKQELRLKSPAFKQAFNNASIEQRSFNGLSYANTTNLVATGMYNETMTDYLKYHDIKIIQAVGNNMWTRAGGKAENIPAELVRGGQFYGVSKHIPNYARLKASPVDANYTLYDPHTEGPMSKAQEAAWKLCNELAVQLLNGTLPNVIGDRNMLANKRIDNADAYEDWGKYCDLKIGSQYYGYDRSQDGYRKYKTKKPANLTHTVEIPQKGAKKVVKPVEYVVQSGDTLSAIAKKFNTTVLKLQAKNKIQKADNIQVGQKIMI